MCNNNYSLYLLLLITQIIINVITYEASRRKPRRNSKPLTISLKHYS